MSLVCQLRIAVRFTARQVAARVRAQHASTEELAVDLPRYIPRKQETLKDRKARLLYQSRKRGTKENCILLSTFFAKFGDKLTEEQLCAYDQLINEPNNDWLIYNWVVKKDEVPEQYQGDVMRLLQEHAANTAKEQRYKQPDLQYGK